MPPPTTFLRCAPSPSLTMSLLPGAVSAGNCFSVPRSLRFQCSQKDSPIPFTVCSALPCKALLAAGNCPGGISLCTRAKEQLR